MTRTALKEVLLKAEGLALSFRGAPPLLRDACLSLRAGQVTVLTGPTGSGKSLLLKRLANQLPNQKTLRSGGHVHVHGSCRLLSQELRYPEVMQLSVSQWLRKQFSRPGSQRATTCAAGRIRRRQLAEVLRHNSQVLLFDEPLAYLDEAGRLFFVQLLQRLRRERRAVLVVESRTAWLEEVADKWLKLENAKIRERRTIGVSLSYGGTTFTSTLDYVEHTLLVHPHFIKVGPRAKALDLDLRQVSLEQPNGKPGVSDIDLRVLGGASIALVGPTGSGKSALAQMMAAQIRPVRGSVWLNKRPLSKWGDVELGEKVGFVPQSLGRASDRSTVRAVIRKSLVGLRWRAQAGNQRTDWALKKLGLEALALRRLETLSYGERRLVAVASLWAQEPDLAIVDEPTAGLDVQNADRVREALEDLSRRGSALILISHDIAFALKLCDRVLLMNQGRIRSDRSVEALQGRRGHVPSSPADLELLHSL